MGPADLSGSILAGRYRLVRLIARGGMGAVYLAEHLMLRGSCAIKILGPRFAQETEYARRFLQEARAASQILHPNVVTITDIGRDGDTMFMVMELLTGRDLAALLREVGGALPWARLAPIVLQIADALQASHRTGLLHRDIKPSNCVCTTLADGSDFVTVVDFGIAKVRDGANLGDQPDERPETDTGTWLGTPEYMAPEIFRGAEPDVRIDVYGLGVLMYKMLTGTTPFAGTRAEQIPLLDRSRPPPPSARSESRVIPHDVDALVLQAIAADPEERFQDMTALITAVMAIPRGDTVVVRDSTSSASGPTNLRSDPSTGDRPTSPHVAIDVSMPVTTPAPSPRIRRRAVLVTSILVLGTVATLATLATRWSAPSDLAHRSLSSLESGEDAHADRSAPIIEVPSKAVDQPETREPALPPPLPDPAAASHKATPAPPNVLAVSPVPQPVQDPKGRVLLALDVEKELKGHSLALSKCYNNITIAAELVAFRVLATGKVKFGTKTREYRNDRASYPLEACLIKVIGALEFGAIVRDVAFGCTIPPDPAHIKCSRVSGA